ncbi:hypothetical protein AWB81_06435 [Caballeronia arationis]|nr:hypothetical protein AWB81_06435 [Caballeronia arationis]
MVRVFSATPVFASFHDYMRRAMQQQPRPVSHQVAKAQLQPLESCSVVISDEARRRLAAEQSCPTHWDWDI